MSSTHKPSPLAIIRANDKRYIGRGTIRLATIPDDIGDEQIAQIVHKANNFDALLIALTMVRMSPAWHDLPSTTRDLAQSALDAAQVKP